MRHLRALILCAFLPCLQVAAQPKPKPEAAPTPKPEATPAPKPTVSVSFTQQSIREDDRVQVQVWLANESDHDLTEVRLHVATPPFIRWVAQECGAAEPDASTVERPLKLGPLPAHAVNSKPLCLRSNSNIVVGDFNLLFTFEYDWQSENRKRSSLVTVEKTLKASLLGSDNVAGIPVGLAGFIVPGLFFWLVVAWFKVAWLPWAAGELALGDRLIYSILMSIGIVVVGAQFDASDISGGLGLVKLGYLALAGATLGAAAGSFDRSIRFLLGRRRKRLDAEAEARLIKLGDGEDALLDKLLDTFPNASRPRAVVTLKDNQTFRGSLARQDKDATGMVGWFQVSLGGEPKAVADGFKQLAGARRWREALAFARRSNLALEARDTIYETTGGTDEPQTYWYFTWPSKMVRNVTNEDGAGDSELITPQ